MAGAWEDAKSKLFADDDMVCITKLFNVFPSIFKDFGFNNVR